ncbi:tRNA (adenosine(37)-N6)-threonylcarbamoyltransferase complex ATPase subunit type 1 TsaE [Candidatus Kaiserbacteria bacterium RIFCSPLOWO2_12_FULL_53_8]|uniref:tRNA threonylcarbamoyladenosine biosynthesis protein TsaE n=2 Tax=Candidatus Kaiseribacteriota TaxID=1752734 RepID=A0A1F6CTK4_9BACT|nr:MAG: tRNA (adenosine(37)-N6)-threonylcarbamoyltransferase complex ATPase subunit type 1 TsaE [Candidatus Kaiserbacteria bacterium RIFCSPHIGHO2_01_FULL_53_29]OGG92135.1 MAG: tRNA (adenosine(37)-N6)-threonylcarbamoyltransferase complex ATPase subunit type 1 TsaE [Candidatus Kaiserbacteria bacterium RIFCSPLOWO2_12_FULL_53_8]
MELRSNSAEELQAHAAEFVSHLQPRQQAVVATLSGELGAGKTTFAQGIAKALGVEEVVTSPTFVLEKIYKLEGQKFQRLIHIDAYRLKSAHELEVLGWEKLLQDSGNLIVLEWPERVVGAIPPHATNIRFDIVDDGRIITLINEYGEEKI